MVLRVDSQSLKVTKACIYAPKNDAGAPPGASHEEPNWSPVIDIHAGLKNSLKI